MQNHFPEAFAKSIIVLISAILDDLQVEKNGKVADNHRLGHNRSFCQLEAYNLNQLASAFPVATRLSLRPELRPRVSPKSCYGVSERNKIGRIPYWEDSPQRLD